MNRKNDRNNKLKNKTTKQKIRMDIIKDLKKAGLKQQDIDYIINELNEIEKIIHNKKIHDYNSDLNR
ncbi:hypothetical protein Klosneuvirus_5_76 [Klosneuvirus KNV1]|uniref:Uncharacterized protein n=1 Tax=Klosneuvirus KNV1 TaxID=1977640 RepID=A0A1V0SL27_9VIRU|nr:hypothetical protein Klosneuvirus_5_76 [Klosneuvirus KNV1]